MRWRRWGLNADGVQTRDGRYAETVPRKPVSYCYRGERRQSFPEWWSIVCGKASIFGSNTHGDRRKRWGILRQELTVVYLKVDFVGFRAHYGFLKSIHCTIEPMYNIPITSQDRTIDRTQCGGIGTPKLIGRRIRMQCAVRGGRSGQRKDYRILQPTK